MSSLPSADHRRERDDQVRSATNRFTASTSGAITSTRCGNFSMPSRSAGRSGSRPSASTMVSENFTASAVLTHAKAATKLQTTLRDAVTGSDYLMQGGRINDTTTLVTNQLDAKPGSPAKGRVLVGDFSQLVVGEFSSAELLANPYAAGYYEKGAIQLRIMATMDMVLRNPKAFVLAEDLAIA